MKNMLTLSNTISLLRIPLAFLFLFQSIKIRLFAIVAATISDCLDGFIARKLGEETFFGKALDPLMDKFFVYFVIGILAYSGDLPAFGLLAMLARDAAIILYIITTVLVYGKKELVFHPAYSSKITTGLQFLTLFAIVIKMSPPVSLYYLFYILSPIIYLELLIYTLNAKKKVIL